MGPRAQDVVVDRDDHLVADPLDVQCVAGFTPGRTVQPQLLGRPSVTRLTTMAALLVASRTSQ
jgi:hypothetical protein